MTGNDFFTSHDDDWGMVYGIALISWDMIWSPVMPCSYQWLVELYFQLVLSMTLLLYRKQVLIPCICWQPSPMF